jgi:hypothetical protein
MQVKSQFNHFVHYTESEHDPYCLQMAFIYKTSKNLNYDKSFFPGGCISHFFCWLQSGEPFTMISRLR